MSFEKRNKESTIVPLASCSGCSNQGSQVYSGKYSSQAASQAGRCSNCS